MRTIWRLLRNTIKAQCELLQQWNKNFIHSLNSSRIPPKIPEFAAWLHTSSHIILSSTPPSKQRIFLWTSSTPWLHSHTLLVLTPFLFPHLSLTFSSKENPKKRLEKEVLLPNIIITLAVLHQGTDFFVAQNNILNKVYPVPRNLSLNFGSGGGSTRSCSICSSGRVSDHPQGWYFQWGVLHPHRVNNKKQYPFLPTLPQHKNIYRS